MKRAAAAALPRGVNFDPRTKRYDVKMRCFETGKRLRTTLQVREEAVALRTEFDKQVAAGRTIPNVRPLRTSEQIRAAATRAALEPDLPRGIKFGNCGGNRRSVYSVRYTTPIGRIESYVHTREAAEQRLALYKRIARDDAPSSTQCSDGESDDDVDGMRIRSAYARWQTASTSTASACTHATRSKRRRAPV